MRAGALIFVWLLCATAAAASPSVSDGVRAFQQGQFEKARDVLADIIAANAAAQDELPIARLYLAAAHHALGDVQRAYQHLLQLKREHPGFLVDPSQFVPDLVALAQKAEFEVREEQEAARAQLEQQQPESSTTAPPEVPAPAPTEVARVAEGEPAAPFAVRAGVQGFTDVMGQRSVGVLALIGASAGSVDGALRIILGQHPAFGVEAAYVLSRGGVQPRLGLRGSVLPFLEGGVGFGGGPFAGVRIPVASSLAVRADAAVEALSVRAPYQPLAVLLSVGVDFAFIGGAQ